MNGKTPRATPVAALHFLLESGADPKQRDDRDVTPMEYAKREKREEAVAVFYEWGCREAKYQ